MTHKSKYQRIVWGSLIAVMTSVWALPAAAITSGSAIATGTYVLHNHPDGSAAAPFYGLRLDDLLGNGIYTFDFDASDMGAAMFLDYDGSTIRIRGNAWGGLDTGSEYVAPELWAIDFTYSNGISSVANGGQDDLQVAAGNAGNGGVISGASGTFNLIDFAGANVYSFQLGDRDGNGHRGFDGTSGWGWVNYYVDGGDPTVHAYHSDWLFTMEPSPVPAPGALWLLGSSALSLSLLRRRRQDSA